ncbi:DUF721 domain-containing protein [Candidatus Uhrbacteria bacterium]|nr:DUF721 domain-containing protein [Candidatus Uhrbacteria bacterium]
MGFASLRHLLPMAANRAGMTRDLAITAALRAAQEALVERFGPGYARFADSVAVRRDGALVIACRSPAVAQTVRFHEAAILTRVRAAASTLAIRRLFLVPRNPEDVAPAPPTGTGEVPEEERER